MKWRSLDYEQITWEEYEDISEYQPQIDAYKRRRENSPHQPPGGIAGVRRRVKYEELSEQPEFLEGGTLRDYQLTGVLSITASRTESRALRRVKLAGKAVAQGQQPNPCR